MAVINIKATPLECGAMVVQQLAEPALKQAMDQAPAVSDAIIYGALTRVAAVSATRIGLARTLAMLDMLKDGLSNSSAAAKFDGGLH